MKINFLLVIICSILFSCNSNEYVAYKPHYMSKNHEKKYYGNTILDSVELKNTIQVFEFYGVNYKVLPNNILMIPNDLNCNWDLLWNYTTKANDTTWLKTHQIMKTL